MDKFAIYFVATEKESNGDIGISDVQKKEIMADDTEDAILMVGEILASTEEKVFYVLRIENKNGTQDFFHRLPQQIKSVYQEYFHRAEIQREASQP